MGSLIICHITRRSYFCDKNDLVLPPLDCYLTCNGHILQEDETFEDGKVYHIIPRLVGGKGGFGSMLRAIGAQIEKTTNHEACRDISGRRLRDVNNEKRLKEWLGKKAEKDRERAKEKQERRERRLAMPNHKFEDEDYHEQRKKVAENQEDALLQGLQKVNKAGPSCTVTSEAASSSGLKRKATACEQGPSAKTKKKTEWLGIDIDDLSDLDSEEESDSSPRQHNSSSNENSCDAYQQKDISKSCDAKFQSDSSTSNSCDNIQDIDDGKLPENNKSNTLHDGIENNESMEKPIGLFESLKSVVPKENVEIDGNTCNKDDNVDKPINLEDFNSAQELLSVGLDRLKTALMDRKLKCGGNLEQRAERLFSIKGLTDDQIPPSLKAKPNKKK